MMKSIGALLAGFVVVVILSIATDMLMKAAGQFPKEEHQRAADIPLVIATIYCTLYGVLGSFITARLAPNRPMRLAMISGLIGFALATLGAVMTWNAGPEFEPKWYPLMLVATALPAAWAGGKLDEAKRR